MRQKKLNESAGNGWRGCDQINLISHGSWADPDLYTVIDGMGCYFNYWDIENALWGDFLEETGHKDSESEDPAVEEEFNEYCQKWAYYYMIDCFNNGYFGNPYEKNEYSNGEFCSWRPSDFDEEEEESLDESKMEPKLNDENDWTNYLTRKLNLDEYHKDMLLHDLNNLRADEWLDSIENSSKIPAKIVDKFKADFHITDDDDDLDEGYTNVSKEKVKYLTKLGKKYAKSVGGKLVGGNIYNLIIEFPDGTQKEISTKDAGLDIDEFNRWGRTKDKMNGKYLFPTHPDVKEGCHGKKKSNKKLKEAYSEEEYRGYTIAYDFYGHGEYSVDYCGDDIICKTREEAKKTIDELIEYDNKMYGPNESVNKKKRLKESEMRTQDCVDDAQMGQWKQICRAFAKKMGAKLLFVNNCSCGLEFPDGTMKHVYIDEMADYLKNEGVNLKMKNKKLTEARGWRYSLKSGSALRQAIDAEDSDEILTQLANCWREINEFMPDEYDESDLENDIDDIENQRDNLENYEEYGMTYEDVTEEIDYLLSQLYDFCDNTRIWVDLD